MADSDKTVPANAWEVLYTLLPIIGDFKVHEMYEARRRLGETCSSHKWEISGYVLKYISYALGIYLLVK
jgi:hypothetical protein